MNFGNPQRPEHYGELVTAIDGLSEAARALALPFVSGNVSLYNEGSNGNPVPASAIIACVGAFADVSIAVTSRFQRIGSAVYLIGKPQTNLGGSVYAELCGIASDALPEIVYEDFRAELALVRTAFDGLMVLSAHDISDGGLLTTLAEMCFDVQAPGTIGLTVDAMNEWVERIGSAGVYFGEAGAIVCEIDATHEAAFLAAAAQHAAAVTKLGITSDDATLRVADRAWPVSELFVAWDAPLGEYYP